jgi:hypothetical protein
MEIIFFNEYSFIPLFGSLSSLAHFLIPPNWEESEGMEYVLIHFYLKSP